MSTRARISLLSYLKIKENEMYTTRHGFFFLVSDFGTLTSSPLSDNLIPIGLIEKSNLAESQLVPQAAFSTYTSEASSLDDDETK